MYGFQLDAILILIEDSCSGWRDARLSGSGLELADITL